jgi:hypothetical protein
MEYNANVAIFQYKSKDFSYNMDGIFISCGKKNITCQKIFFFHMVKISIYFFSYLISHVHVFITRVHKLVAHVHVLALL